MRCVERVVDRHPGVGQPVDLVQREPEPPLELRLPPRHRDAPGQPDPVPAVQLRGRLLPEHGQGGAHEVEDRGLEPADLATGRANRVRERLRGWVLPSRIGFLDDDEPVPVGEQRDRCDERVAVLAPADERPRVRQDRQGPASFLHHQV